MLTAHIVTVEDITIELWQIVASASTTSGLRLKRIECAVGRPEWRTRWRAIDPHAATEWVEIYRGPDPAQAVAAYNDEG